MNAVTRICWFFSLVFLAGISDAQTAHEHSSHATTSDYIVTNPAPIGMMGAGAQEHGGLMLALRYKAMGMDDLYNGSDSISEAELFDQTGPYRYKILPTSMSTQAIVASAMYTPFDFVTVSLMVPYMFREMEMLTLSGVHFRTRSNGIGDVRLMAMSQLVDRKNGYFQIKLGISFPSGSINEEDTTPMSGGAEVQLPYLMQMGSGTWDLLPSASVGGNLGRLAWGLQAGGVIRMTTNENGYRLGNIYEFNGWGEWAFTRWLAASVRLAWKEQFQIKGSDRRLPAMAAAMTPSADPENLGLKQLDGFIGIQLLGQKGWLAGNRIALEIGMPFWQATSGPGLARSFFVTLGLTREF